MNLKLILPILEVLAGNVGDVWRNRNNNSWYGTRHGTPSSGKLRSKKAKKERINVSKIFGKNKKSRRRR